MGWKATANKLFYPLSPTVEKIVYLPVCISTLIRPIHFLSANFNKRNMYTYIIYNFFLYIFFFHLTLFFQKLLSAEWQTMYISISRAIQPTLIF